MEASDDLPVEKMDVVEQPSDKNLPDDILTVPDTNSTKDANPAQQHIVEIEDGEKQDNNEKKDEPEVIEVLTDDEVQEEETSSAEKDGEKKPAEVEENKSAEFAEKKDNGIKPAEVGEKKEEEMKPAEVEKSEPEAKETTTKIPQNENDASGSQNPMEVIDVDMDDASGSQNPVEVSDADMDDNEATAKEMAPSKDNALDSQNLVEVSDSDMDDAEVPTKKTAPSGDNASSSENHMEVIDVDMDDSKVPAKETAPNSNPSSENLVEVIDADVDNSKVPAKETASKSNPSSENPVEVIDSNMDNSKIPAKETASKSNPSSENLVEVIDADMDNNKVPNKETAPSINPSSENPVKVIDADIDNSKVPAKETAPSKDDDSHSQNPVEVIDTDTSEVAMEVEPSLSVQTEVMPFSTEPQSPRVIDILDDEDDDETVAGKSAIKSEDVSKSVPSELESSAPASLLVSKADTKIESKSEPVIPSSSDDEESIYYDKECVNYDCLRGSKKFYKAPLFVLNFYKIQRKTNKVQFVCNDCYNAAVAKYGILATALETKKPLLEQEIPKRQDYVEILDSSDEDEGSMGGKLRAEKELDVETLEMLQEEMDNTICEILSRVEIQNQVNWSKNILMERLKRAEVECEEISESLKMLQKNADNMHTQLYQCPKIKIKELQALDLNTGRPYAHDADVTIPPVGELKFRPIDTKSTYYAVRNKAIASWLPCQMVEALDVAISGQKLVKYYKVRYHMLKIPTVKCVSSKHMAYGDAPNVRLSVGTRVIALFDGTTLSRSNREIIAPNAFYPGIVAEQLQVYNKYRYLIFFDDGYAQYVHHKDVRVVCFASENVWDDVHPASREFIHNYLSQYQKHRPMVQVKKGQSMITESNGKWLYAKVIDVDASLVQMQFEGQNRFEWIYRGSTRLGPLFKEKQANGAAAATTQSSILRRTEPYVRYDEDAARNDAAQQQAAAVEKQTSRAVAKKSTSRQESQNSSSSNSVAPTVKHLNNETIFLEDDARPKGKVVYYTAKKNLPPKPFVPHQCNPNCLFTITHNLHSYSPLAKPLLSGWERQIFKSKLKKSVVYRGPCGRRIRNMEELHRYLRLTKDTLNVDNFDFDCAIHCLAEYVIESSIVTKTDLSNGLENMVIPCINYYDNSMPPYCEYSVERIPTEGVRMNLDPAFLCGCDCEDDCMDKSKCSCWQLTLSGARFGNPNTPPENVGYSFKRLLEPVPTGIYECNVNCRCSKSCVNRVVQHALQVKLQVFKTSNRGWGLRCLNDIPKGTFICIYAGHLLTEQKANEGGLNASDEYFAELDYIEVVERLKEGYESDVEEEIENDEDLDETVADADSDEEFRSKCILENKDASINTRLRTRRSTIEEDKGGKKNTDGTEDSQERRVINFEPETSLGNEEQTQPSTKYKSIRKYFGKNEFCYIMDAKKTGNIGRYFNHSCAPNLFVQNVFVDTQDLRFPWVAFFALTHIRAGTELTWNYNYEVGIVPGKVLYCECGAPNCRGRLL